MKGNGSCLSETQGGALVYAVWGALAALITWPISVHLGKGYGLTFCLTLLAMNLAIPIIGGPVIFIRNRLAVRRLKQMPCGGCGEVPGPRALVEWVGGDVHIQCPGCGQKLWVKTW